ncbi:MAG TPA: hypothetical protein VK922_13945, partial [Gemmatimonadaceae bacterium]|nr:hypothetical protein [Gemmatimonadaceae bacterium]
MMSTRACTSIRSLFVLPLAVSVAVAQPNPPSLRTLDSIAAAPVLQERVVGLVAAVVRGNDTLLMKAYGK